MKNLTVKAFNDLFDAIRDEYPDGEGISLEAQLAIMISLTKVVERLGLTIDKDGTVKELNTMAL